MDEDILEDDIEDPVNEHFNELECELKAREYDEWVANWQRYSD